jgi:hypothetical protein
LNYSKPPLTWILDPSLRLAEQLMVFFSNVLSMSTNKICKRMYVTVENNSIIQSKQNRWTGQLWEIFILSSGLWSSDKSRFHPFKISRIGEQNSDEKYSSVMSSSIIWWNLLSFLRNKQNRWKALCWKYSIVEWSSIISWISLSFLPSLYDRWTVSLANVYSIFILPFNESVFSNFASNWQT